MQNFTTTMSVLRFGEFELDEQTFELRRKGVPARIQQQPARVLAMLIGNRGVMVTREQIRAAIWGNDTFVDFEQGLNYCIRQIRLTLSDQAESPRFIETLPRLGYRFIAPIERIGAVEVLSNGHKPAASRRIRIAMAPFELLGGTEEDYFAAGLTDDMISALSQIDPSKLRVTAVPRLLPGDLASDQMDRLQRELDLDYLLRGSVRRAAGAVRIGVQLHDLRDKSVLWSKNYDRPTADLLAVQDEVTLSVSHSLALELLPDGNAGSRRYAESAGAYDAFLKGRFFWHKMTGDGIKSSLTYFTDAITLDPKFAPAYAGLAECYLQMGSIRVGIMKPLEALAKARPLLQRAMDLDSNMAEAHCTLGLLKSWYDLDWAGAEAEFQLALSLDPSHLTTLLWQSLYLTAMGRVDEAVASLRRARESEPLSSPINMYYAFSLTNSGQYDLGIRQHKLAMELDPSYYRPHLFLGLLYQDLGRHEESLAEFQQALAMAPENLESLAFSSIAMAKLGNRKGALSVIKKIEAAKNRTDPALLLSFVYAGLGEADEMFRLLNHALENKCAPLYLFVIQKVFRPFDKDPRSAAFRAALGIPSRSNS